MQVGEEGEGRRAEDFIGARRGGGADFDPGNGGGNCHGGTSSRRESASAPSLARNARLLQGSARIEFHHGAPIGPKEPDFGFQAAWS
jgi:hypothetical protein